MKDTDGFTPEHMKELVRFYNNHTDKLARIHRAYLGSTGLSPEGVEEVIRRADPSLAHHDRLGSIGGLPKSQHAAAVRALHEQELSGAERPGAAHKNESDNERTDRYVSSRSSRPRLGRHERRTRLVR
jgi:hypothetical protein